MKRSLFCAVLLMAIASVSMAATPPATPPFDYRETLYKQQPNPTNPDGGWTERVYVYMGNNGPNEGPGYNLAEFKVVDGAGRAVCTGEWFRELAGIPALKTYAPYSFQVVYPKPAPPTFVAGRPVVRPALSKPVQYKVSFIVYAEYGQADTNQSNNQPLTQSFAFAAGGTPSCTRIVRPTFHQ